MNRQSAGLTVFFEGQFWVGIFERVSGDRLSVCRHIFGAEPKDSEVWEFILRDYERLKFSPEVESPVRKAADNPKRGSALPENSCKLRALELSPSRRCKCSVRK